tara:strand:+ start:9871 stop:10638 length:768 start_codon:yes stop_codon:yes gene_type:complete
MYLGACSDNSQHTKINTTGYPLSERTLEGKMMGLVKKIPDEFIEANIYSESGGDSNAERYEAHINDHSYGLMQILTETAREISKRNPDLPSLDLNLDEDITQEEVKTSLLNPQINILYGTRLLEEEFDRYGSLELAVAAYNAGSRAPRNALTQFQLNEVYQENLDTDGSIGPLSKEVVSRFQEQYELDMDGIPGPKTRAKLNEVYREMFPNQKLPSGLIPQNGITPRHVRKVMDRYQENLNKTIHTVISNRLNQR